MEPEKINFEPELHYSINEVTPLSKYLAMVLFVILPFLGGWIGYVYAPDKIVVEEKVIYKEVKEIDQSQNAQEFDKVEISDNADVPATEKVEVKSVPGGPSVENKNVVVSPESKPPYYIESGEVKVNKNNKTFEAKVMFGLADIITIQGVYLSEANLLDEVLQQIVSKSGRNAKYVDKNNITISYVQ
ncbi:hypothetical protein H6784_04095 [Candidatus Nomurabacteria bacterium]|nr:hypothetical protein [Candidatus Kaiserbacteria bacterium]MCB9814569.1 hypothetical protein [Candidatus Nomurabacteria bacterium]